MNFPAQIILLCIASALRANPIVVGELDERPLTSENVTVQFTKDEAVVEGVYVFDTSDRHLGIMQMILPVVASESEMIEGSAARFRINASGSFLGVQQSPEFREAYQFEKRLATGLPKGTKLIFASWQVGAIDSAKRSVITITYRQPLHNGVFYYLPLTKWRVTEPELASGTPNYGLVMKIAAEPDQDVSLAESSNAAIWNNGSATVYLKHRNLIAAKQAHRSQEIGREAPWFEIVQGVRQCATHHTELQVRTAVVHKEWRNIMATNLEPYEDCPNAFLGSLATLKAHTDAVELSYETCSNCEELAAKRRGQQSAKANRAK